MNITEVAAVMNIIVKDTYTLDVLEKLAGTIHAFPSAER